MIYNIVILGESMLKELVSAEDAACAAGVLCRFVHYWRQSPKIENWLLSLIPENHWENS